MTLSALDISIFFLFLFVNLFVGLFFSRNVKTLKDYAIGRSSFPFFLLAATIAATWTTGSGFSFYLNSFINEGVFGVGIAVSATLTLLLVGVLAMRAGEFHGKLSVAESLGSIYGMRVRVVSGIASIVWLVGNLAAQFIMGAKVLGYLFATDSGVVLWGMAAIVILYTVFGGIRSVVFTDFFQFVLMGIFIPLLGLSIYAKLRPGTTFFSEGTINNFSSTTLFSDPKTLGLFTLDFVHSLFIGFHPAIFHRLLLTRNPLKARRSFFGAGLCWVYIMAGVIGLSVLLRADGVPFFKDAKLLVPHIIKKYGYPGFQGLMAVGLMTMMMSSADSYMNTASVLFANDIVRPIKKVKNPLLVARCFGVVLGLFGVVTALYVPSLSVLINLSGAFYLPVVVVPLLLALLGFRTTSRATLFGMCIGSGCSLILSYLSGSLIGMATGMTASIVVIFLCHYLFKEPGGWVGIKAPWPLIAERQKWSYRWKRWKAQWRSAKIYRYLMGNLPSQEQAYLWVGGYILTFIYGGCYFVDQAVGTSSLFRTLLYTALAINALILTYPIYPKEFKRRGWIACLWNFGLFFIFFVVQPVFVVLSDYHSGPLAIFCCNMMIAALLFQWQSVLTMLITGALFAVSLCKYAGYDLLMSTMPNQLLFLLLLGNSLLISLFRQRSKSQERALTSATSAHLERRTREELQHVQQAQKTFSETLQERMSVSFTKMQRTLAGMQQRAPQEGIYQVMEELSNFQDYLVQETQPIQEQVVMHIEEYRLSSLLEDWQLHAAKNKRDIILIIDHQAKVDCIQVDKIQCFAMLDRLLDMAQTHYPSHTPFALHTVTARLHYELASQVLPAVEFFLLPANTAIETPAKTRSYAFHDHMLLLDELLQNDAMQRPILEAVYLHYGILQRNSSPEVHIVLPTELRKLRPKIEIAKKKKTKYCFSSKELLASLRAEHAFWGVVMSHNYDFCRLEKAVDMMKKFHANQQRKSGEPFFLHPLMVARKVSTYSKDENTLIAALLHDTVEDTPATLVDIGVTFGKEVALLVDQVTKLRSGLRKYRLQYDEVKAKLTNRANKEAILIKLCDRIHNLETLSSLTEEKKLRTIQETEEHYIPWAKAHGWGKLVEVFKKLCNPPHGPNKEEETTTPS